MNEAQMYQGHLIELNVIEARQGFQYSYFIDTHHRFQGSLNSLDFRSARAEAIRRAQRSIKFLDAMSPSPAPRPAPLSTGAPSATSPSSRRAALRAPSGEASWFERAARIVGKRLVQRERRFYASSVD